MGLGETSVDQVWAEMQRQDSEQRGAARRTATVQTAPHDAALRAILRGVPAKRGKKAKKAKAARASKSRPLESSPIDTPAQEEASPVSTDEETRARDGAAAKPSTNGASGEERGSQPPALEDPALLLRIMQRDINLISAEDVVSRKQALSRVSALLFKSDGQPLLSGEVLEKVFEEIQKPLLRRVADPSEKCREMVVKLLTHFLRVCQDLGRVLPYLFPALMERNSQSFMVDFDNNEMVRDLEAHEAKQRGKALPMPDAGTTFVHTVCEPSEEVRMQLCTMLGALVHSLTSRGLHAMLGPYFHDTVMFFHACAVDPFPALRIEGLGWLQRLAEEERFANTMHHFCTALVRSVMPGIRHRQSKVRIAALEAVGALVACPFRAKCRGGGTEAIADLVGYRDDNVVPLCAFYQGETRLNYFGFVVRDSSPFVRMAFYRVIARWMTTLLDRWDHAARLLPFLLSALSDECEGAQQLGLDTLEALGKEYEEEHSKEVLEKRQYGVDGALGRANYDKPLPRPWTKRPSLGTRMYVRQHSRRFLGTVLRELNDWKAPTKESAVELLKAVLVYTEEHVTMELHGLVKALVFLADDPAIEGSIEQCAGLTGRFVEPEAYLKLLLPHVCGEEGTLATVAHARCAAQARALRVLTAMLAGARASQILPHFTQLAQVVADAGLTRASREHSRLQAAQAGMLRFLAGLVRDGGGRAAMDAHFVATGRLGSLQRDYEKLLVLSLRLECAEPYQTFLELVPEAQTQLREALRDGVARDPAEGWQAAAAFVRLTATADPAAVPDQVESVCALLSTTRGGEAYAEAALSELALAPFMRELSASRELLGTALEGASARAEARRQEAEAEQQGKESVAETAEQRDFADSSAVPSSST